MPETAAPDIDLVRRARKGDRTAFEELVRRTTRLVYARLFLETGDRDGAEDLVQEAFLTAYRKLGQLKSPEGFRSWLLTIAHNAAVSAHRRDHRRKRSGPQAHGVDPAELAGEADPSADAEREEQRSRLLSKIRSLPENYRLPLMMRFLYGADYETMTDQLGLSNGALRGLLHRGIRILRKELKGG